MCLAFNENFVDSSPFDDGDLLQLLTTTAVLPFVTPHSLPDLYNIHPTLVALFFSMLTASFSPALTESIFPMSIIQTIGMGSDVLTSQ